MQLDSLTEDWGRVRLHQALCTSYITWPVLVMLRKAMLYTWLGAQGILDKPWQRRSRYNEIPPRATGNTMDPGHMPDLGN